MKKFENFINNHYPGIIGFLFVLALFFGMCLNQVYQDKGYLKEEVQRLYVENREMAEQLEIFSQMAGEQTDGNSRLDQTIVYINDSGEKYHKKFCRYVKSSSDKVFLYVAKSSGYTACAVCKP